MYCKHCGQPLDDNSSFCPSCGGKVELPPLRTDAPGTLQPSPLSTAQDKGFLVCGLVFAGFELFWFILPALYKRGLDLQLISGPISFLFSAMPLLYAYYTANRRHRSSLIILGFAMMLLNLSRHLFQL